jgi:hypothetical protein
MPVVSPKRHVLRGTIRAQTQYAVTLCNRLLRAYAKNHDLQLFIPGVGFPSPENMAQIVAQWQSALSLRL